ncbi:MAG TPA: Ig-like domain-containing protein [Longimicrobium sp.]|nr:Ig-like domain-containing protein [Longimicrobium sp.]
MKRLAGVLCLGLLPACGDGTGPSPAKEPAKVEPTSPFLIFDSIGAEVPLSVVVTDSGGGVVAGVIVTWQAQQGGVATPASSTTDASGIASTTWKLGTGVGSQYITAIAGSRASVEIRAQARAGAPAEVRISEDSVLIGAVGDTRRVAASVRDRGGNVLTEILQWTVRAPELLQVERSIATPDSFALTARGAGSTYAVAQVGGVRDSVKVRVPAWGFVATDYQRTCVLTPEGAAYCWGYNLGGAVGDGTAVTRTDPSPVSTGLAFSAVSTGRHFTCGLTTAGAAHCWGANPYGEVGAGDEAMEHLTPRAVAGGRTFATLSAGFGSTCALTPAGEAFCWGANFQGELGRDTLTDTCAASSVPRCSSVPLAVSGGLRFTRVSVGENNHVCAVTAAGEAWCWGQNASSQLGTSVAPDTCVFDLPCVRSPARVETATAFTTIVAGWNYTCALDAGGQAWCWGMGFGARPAAIPGGRAFVEIDAGAGAMCGRTAAGAVYCWGSALGTTPLPRSGALPVQSLSVGEASLGSANVRICGTLAGGGVQCWSGGSSQP